MGNGGRRDYFRFAKKKNSLHDLIRISYCRISHTFVAKTENSLETFLELVCICLNGILANEE